MIQGKCDLMIQQVSSWISSPFMPSICMFVSVMRVLSDPVGTPVSISRYLRRKVFPERGKEQKLTLLPRMGYPSKKTAPPELFSKIHLFRSQRTWFFDLKRAMSCLKLMTGVEGMARMW